MREYQAYGPEAEVRGQVILATVRALGERAQPTLQQHGLDTVNPEQWYSQQAWLDALQDISESLDADFFDLVAVGKATSEAAMLPDGIDSAQAALMLMAKTYPMNNRNCEGYISTEAISPTTYRITVCNPYPREMMYGVIWGFASRFEPGAIVEYADGDPCSSESECCVYQVSWSA